jgi:hypothetical protein
MLSEKQRPNAVNIKKLKEFAADCLPTCSTLREVIMQEKTTLSVNDFISKVGVWLKILRTEVE